MKSAVDPLLRTSNSERLHYATGELLGADDFRDEQTYHRRQLARALLHLNGSGTLAGLRVVARHRPGQNGAPDEVDLEVSPGSRSTTRAVSSKCPAKPVCACVAGSSSSPRSPRTAPCWTRVTCAPHCATAPWWRTFSSRFIRARGYTPAFASGPFDALDASQPSRVRDAYELSLVLRPEENPPTAFDAWAVIQGASPADRLAAAQRASLNATLALSCRRRTSWRLAENRPGQILRPCCLPGSAFPPPRQRTRQGTGAGLVRRGMAAPSPAPPAPPEKTPNVDNTVRNFLLPPAALRRLAGV